MNCQGAFDALYKREGEHLEDGVERTLQQHLAVCSSCREMSEAFGSAVENLGPRSQVTASADFASRTWDKIVAHPVRPQWESVQSRGLLERLLEFRGLFSKGGLVLATGLALALLCWLDPTILPKPTQPARGEKTERQNYQLIQIEEGRSVVVPHGEYARVQVEGPAILRFYKDPFCEIEKGKATFEVNPRKKHHPYTTRTPHLSVEVLGTVYVVEVGPASSLVQLVRGRVVVSTAGRQTTLEAGDHFSSNDDRILAVAETTASPTRTAPAPSPAIPGEQPSDDRPVRPLSAREGIPEQTGDGTVNNPFNK